jgi:hypothetical protein
MSSEAMVRLWADLRVWRHQQDRAKARTWFVQNRRSWWNREPYIWFPASSDAVAADILIALSARKA